MHATPLLRFYLLLGLIVHKGIWEVLKRRTVHAAPAETSTQHLVKAVKVAILLGIVVQTLLPFDLLPISPGSLMQRAVGAVLYTIGLLIAISARLQLGRNWSDIEKPTVSGQQTVVSRGIYGYVRHPIYAGDILLLLGLELALNSWFVLAIFALIPMVYRRAVLEEKMLAQHLPGYDSYVRRTKRFIPFVV